MFKMCRKYGEFRISRKAVCSISAPAPIFAENSDLGFRDK